MTTGATGQLGLALPVQGELSGTWGDTVNNGITQYTNIAIAATLTLTGDGAVTLANTTGDASASNITSTLAGAGTVTAQFAIVQVSGTTTTKVITGPSYSKTYVVDNASSYAVTFKASGQTGVSVAAGEKVTVFYNGTDYLKIAGTIANAAGSNTQIQFNSGGLFGASANLTWDGTTLSSTQVNITGQGTLRLQDTTGGEYVAHRAPSALGASYTLTWPADDGTSGQALVTDGSGVLSWSTAASGDVYGPASATDNAVARFDTTTGKLIQNSVVTIGDTGDVAGVAALSASSSVTLSGGTANGVTYLNGSKVLTSGSALTFDGTNLGAGGSPTAYSGYGPTIGTKGGNGGIFQSQNSAGTANALFYIDGNIGAAYLNTLTNHPWAFKVNDVEGMRLTSTGLGIGTSSPTVKLDVSAPNDSTARIKLTTTTGYNIFWSSNTGGGTFFGTEGSTGGVLSAGSAAYSSVMTSLNANNPLSFGINGTERMRLDGSGNLGLGVTPSAWSLVRGLQNGRANLVGYASNAEGAWLTNNAYYNGSSWVYQTSSQATMYQQLSGVQSWHIAGAGTAGNTFSFTQAMTLDASGNLGLGTTSPNAKLDIVATTNTIRLGRSTSSYSTIDSNSGAGSLNFNADAGNIAGGGSMTFSFAGTEAMRIDSSRNLLVGGTSTSGINSGGGFYVNANSLNTYTMTSHVTGSASGSPYAYFYYANSYIGQISQSGTTGVNYTSASDYRLKNITGPVTGAKEFIMALKPKKGTWKSDGSPFVGFLAHEFQEVSPSSVSGEKDAVDENGNPIMQSMQASSPEVMANLVSLIQEQQAIIDSLKARLDAANL